MRPIALALPLLLLPLLPATAAHAGGGGWVQAKKTSKVTIYNRTRSGSKVKELKAIGVINAPPWVCKNVVDDVGRFNEFMPYTEVSDVLKRGKGTVVHYQRIDAPFVSDRDYTIIGTDRSKRLPDGTIVYKKTWNGANNLGPKKKSGVVRVEVVEGFWQFEPVDGGKKSKTTYYLYTDPGGALPSFVINAANGRAIPGVFEAVEKKAQNDPRYRKAKPKIWAEAEAPPATMSPGPAKPAAK